MSPLHNYQFPSHHLDPEILQYIITSPRCFRFPAVGHLLIFPILRHGERNQKNYSSPHRCAMRTAQKLQGHAMSGQELTSWTCLTEYFEYLAITQHSAQWKWFMILPSNLHVKHPELHWLQQVSTMVFQSCQWMSPTPKDIEIRLQCWKLIGLQTHWLVSYLNKLTWILKLHIRRLHTVKQLRKFEDPQILRYHEIRWYPPFLLNLPPKTKNHQKSFACSKFGLFCTLWRRHWRCLRMQGANHEQNHGKADQGLVI